MKKNYKRQAIKAKCVGCGKVYTVDEKGLAEARDIGCLMSPCCCLPATVEKVTIKVSD
jgi:hypothetical protein